MAEQMMQEAAGKAIPAGYKQTEVGVIPEEWDVATIEELADIIDPQPDHRTPPESSNGEPYIGISDFINSREVDWAASRKIISKAVDKQEKCFQLQKGDIVFGKIGTIGVPKFVPQVPFRFALSANVILLHPKNVESIYLMGFFYSEFFQKTLKSELHSTSQAAFGMNKMRLIKLPLPPKEEQTAIANVLSDSDALIDALEQLIAKKQAIKTATMQQLLTGRTRLPQFALRSDGTPKGYKTSELGQIPEDWKVLPLGELCHFENGDRSSNYPSSDEFVSFGIPFINAGHIDNGVIDSKGMDYISAVIYARLGGGKVKPGDLVYCLRGSLGKFGVVPDDFGMGAIASSLVIVRPITSRTSCEFISEYFKSDISKRMVSLWAGGAAQPNLGAKELANFLVPLPNNLEQTAIATILSDMDSELTALEQKLAKARDVKQGMMQQLLTGRIRLPVEQVE